MVNGYDDIHLFAHCRICISELPAGLSPKEWVQIEVGLTSKGIMVWCKRHEVVVCEWTPGDVAKALEGNTDCAHCKEREKGEW